MTDGLAQFVAVVAGVCILIVSPTWPAIALFAIIVVCVVVDIRAAARSAAKRKRESGRSAV